jgi:hypothetical protein
MAYKEEQFHTIENKQSVAIKKPSEQSDGSLKSIFPVWFKILKTGIK